MSLAMILAGTAMVLLALFNRVPRVGSGRLSRSSQHLAAPGKARPRLVHARLTETGRAALTAVGGSVLIIAFFLALSGF